MKDGHTPGTIGSSLAYFIICADGYHALRGAPPSENRARIEINRLAAWLAAQREGPTPPCLFTNGLL